MPVYRGPTRSLIAGGLVPRSASHSARCGTNAVGDAAGQGAVLPAAVLIRRGARCCPRGCGGRILAEAVGAPAQFANLPRLVCILFSAVAASCLRLIEHPAHKRALAQCYPASCFLRHGVPLSPFCHVHCAICKIG